MAQRVYVEPIRYQVGVDITEERYREAIQKIGDWFAQKRSTKEPGTAAKLALDDCLAGMTSDGKPWFAMALAPLNKRVRVKCNFDLDSMQPLLTASDKQKAKKTKEKLREQKKRQQQKQDPLMPDELREEARRKGVTYGDNANLRFTSAEEQRWRAVRAGYIQEFPHLNSVNAQAELDQLCDLIVLQERKRLRVLSGQDVNPLDRTAHVDDIQKLKKALGIHPEQLKNKVQQKADMSIGAAAAKLGDIKDWRKVRLRFLAEQWLQAFQMSITPTADGLDYQLNEEELFAMTKCRTCHCHACGEQNFAGFGKAEVRQYLIDQGLLVATGEVREVVTPRPPEETEDEPPPAADDDPATVAEGDA